MTRLAWPAFLVALGCGSSAASSTHEPTAQPPEAAPRPLSAPASSPCATQAEPADASLIRVFAPQAGARAHSPLTVRGEARGNWYFEADFPVALYDARGSLLARGIARAQGEWMTQELVPFELSLSFSAPTAGAGRLVLYKNNPSDLREHDAELCIPVRF
jgi:hypothetical protein